MNPHPVQIGANGLEQTQGQQRLPGRAALSAPPARLVPKRLTAGVGDAGGCGGGDEAGFVVVAFIADALVEKDR